MNLKQPTLTGLESAFTQSRRKIHGGAHASGRRKERRPMVETKPLHVVLRSIHATGKLSMLHPKHEKRIAHVLKFEAKRSGIRLYRFVNVGNHIHLILLPVKRTFAQKFLRTISGKIARIVTGAEKGRPFGRFWEALAFSRVIEWGKDFVNAKSYLEKNGIEALGWGDLVKKSIRTKKTRRPSSTHHGPDSAR